LGLHWLLKKSDQTLVVQALRQLTMHEMRWWWWRRLLLLLLLQTCRLPMLMLQMTEQVLLYFGQT
jgi:hypothetical protein